MKIRKKIWFAPMAALALVLMLVGVVFAAAPKMETQIPEQTIIIGATDDTSGAVGTPGENVTVNLSDVNGDGTADDPAFADPDSTATDNVLLAYTAMTSDADIANVDMGANPGSAVATAWWNGLGDRTGANALDNANCDAKAMRLGFSLTADEDDPADGPDNAPAKAAVGETAAVDAIGFCLDTDEGLTGNLHDADDTVTPTLVALTAVNAIPVAFHWDMLSGPQMVVAARAAGERNAAAYEKLFGDLTHAQKLKVMGWFGEVNILARGESNGDDALNLVLDHEGINGIDHDNDNDADTTDDREGKVGSTTIIVKASDADGRLIPPPNGSGTVGQSFTVNAKLTDATGLQDFGSSDTDSITVEAGEGNLVTRVNFPGDTVGDVGIDYRVDTDDTSQRYEIRVSPNAEDIGEVALGTGYTLSPHQQAITFGLTNGGDVAFQVAQAQRATSADITTKSGVDLTSTEPYKFTLVVNEIARAPQNSKSIDVWVIVVLDNVSPMIVSPPASGTVAERAKDATIADFDASDANNQVVTWTISENAIDLGLTIDEDGVLKTTSVVEDPGPDQPDFIEDDPETEDTDESENADGTSKNVHEITITASDGTLTGSATLTLTVTDEPEPIPGSNQKLNADEGVGTASTTDSHVGFAPELSEEGTYKIGQQIDNLGNITLEEEDILFGIDIDSGAIYLKEGKKLDFESGLVTYTLSITQGDESGIVVISVNDVNEGPKFHENDHKMYDLENAESDDNEIVLYVLESATVGSIVKIGKDAGGNPSTKNAIFAAMDEDTKAIFRGTAYDLWYDADTTDDDEFTDSYAGTLGDGELALFTVDADGAVMVATELDTDADDSEPSISLQLRTYDTTEVIPGPIDEDDDTPVELRRVLKDVLPIRIEIIDTNVAPVFDDPSRAQTHASVSEGAVVGTPVYTYRAEDEDGDTVRYRLRDQDDAPFFTVEETLNAANEEIGVLKTAAGLDYETQTSHTVEIQAYDTDGDTDEIVITVDVENANDNSPAFNVAPVANLTVAENRPRGISLGSYAATDADGDTVTYSLSGTDAKSFHIDGYGELKTLESLDYDSNTPCSASGCSVTVVASDANAASGEPANGHSGPTEAAVIISVSPIEDSVSTLNVTKANPVPGTTRGDPMTALGNTKESVSADVPERPADLPNAIGAPMNFVETDWASWGTVLRIQVTAQSPDANCGSGNECVVLSLNSDSAGDTLKVQAYRMDTPPDAASNENKFVAAVMLVELDGDATDIKTSSNDDIPVYAHGDGSVARLQVDEEDEIEIEFYNLRGDIEVENESPEISNFAPEHESAFDDPDVEYTFTVTDSHSGLPEPEDLPDADGDDAYMPAVALISKGQCEGNGS